MPKNRRPSGGEGRDGRRGEFVHARLGELELENERLRRELDECRPREQEFRTLLDNSPDVVARFDRELRCLYVNRALQRYTGLPCTELVGKRLNEWGLPGDIEAEWADHLSAVFESGKKMSIEASYKTPGGRELAFDTLLIPEFAMNGNGSVETVVNLIHDISGRKQIETTLKQTTDRIVRSKELSNALVRINLLIHSLLDIDQIMGRVVKEAAEAVGAESGVIYVREADCWCARYTFGQLATIEGQRFSEQALRDSVRAIREKRTIMSNDAIADPDVNRQLVEQHGVRAVLDVGLFMAEQPVGDFGLYYHTPDKSFTDAEREFMDIAGAAVGVALQNADRFAQVEQGREALRRSNKELEQFAYIASHDLKAPLRAISQLAAWVDEDAAERLDEENRERLRLMRDRAAQMNRLIEGLLTYSRADRATGDVREPISLSTIIDELIRELPLPTGFQVQIEGRLPTLNADALHVRQIFQNLINNAVAHHDNPESGKVWISAEEEEGYRRIEVADDGPGVPPEQREDIFRIFTSSKDRRAAEKHAGIGLAIVRKLVHSYGGKIDVTENSPRGARFRIWWPK